MLLTYRQTRMTTAVRRRRKSDSDACCDGTLQMNPVDLGHPFTEKMQQGSPSIHETNGCHEKSVPMSPMETVNPSTDAFHGSNKPVQSNSEYPVDTVQMHSLDTGSSCTETSSNGNQLYSESVITEAAIPEPTVKVPIDLNPFSVAVNGAKKGWKFRRLHSHYRKQEQLLSSYQHLDELEDHPFPTAKEHQEEQARQEDTTVIPKLAFAMNMCILISKIVAVALSSDSVAIISSLVDSTIDFAASMMVWYTMSKMKKYAPQKYPQGRARLEPISIVILSAIMGSASLQVMVQGVQKIVKNEPLEPLAIPTIVIMAVTVVINFIFFVVYRSHKRQIGLLSGRAADPEFLNQLTYVCVNHDNILRVDTVQGYHVGYNLLVEVHIVMPPDMSLREAHDIGESLQRKLERMDIVERAFVHLDYETDHKAHDEHKIL